MTTLKEINSRTPLSPEQTRIDSLQKMPRWLYLQMLSSAISSGEYRFAREAALAWLAAYPGDLQASLRYAQALLGDKHPRQALPVLERICNADPEFKEAVETLLRAEMQLSARRAPDFMAHVLALGGHVKQQLTVAAWGKNLWFSRQALQRGDLEQAEQMIRYALAADPPTPLAAVTHLQILAAAGQTPLPARRSLGEFYHQRWPDCLACTLYLAEWLMDGGDSERAVALLHQAAAGDIGGQIALRLWGEDHPYQAIWPQNLEIPLTVPVPASVASSLGWNQLESGNGPQYADGYPDLAAITRQMGPATGSKELSAAPPAGLAQNTGPSFGSSRNGAAPAAQAVQTPPAETLQPIAGQLEQVASIQISSDGTRRSELTPVYVLLTVRSRLESQYGTQGAAAIEAEMGRLVETIKSRTNWSTTFPWEPKNTWGAFLFCADQPHPDPDLKTQPARPGDAWELKLALSDLDASLQKRGERVGAVLIVGGPEIVPFHDLPNPIDDDDHEIPSDNPYGTRDENYFIPEWPVGRLPGGAGQDPELLLALLSRIRSNHLTQEQRIAWHQRLLEFLLSLIRPHLPGERLSLGYSAAIWRRASLAVFDPIGEPRDMLVSPPVGLVDGNSNLVPLPVARLGYFNLHGLVDAAEWYGQRDPSDQGDGPDYPIALRPQDLLPGGRLPRVVFTEACYGGHIQDKTPQESLALKFLAAGSQAVAASTSMSYGSISTPLIAADLLGYAFWDAIRHGLTAGEALRRAKIHLAGKMDQRQGYLDGEDQKTLISFVLYGDPLAQPYKPGSSPKRKPILRQAPPVLKMICDRGDDACPDQPIPTETLDFVKHLVSQYLPGMQDACVSISQEQAECHGQHNCPTRQMRQKVPIEKKPARRLVTLSKQVIRSQHVHTQYARLTLDAQGKLVKLVVSR